LVFRLIRKFCYWSSPRRVQDITLVHFCPQFRFAPAFADRYTCLVAGICITCRLGCFLIPQRFREIIFPSHPTHSLHLSAIASRHPSIRASENSKLIAIIEPYPDASTTSPLLRNLSIFTLSASRRRQDVGRGKPASRCPASSSFSGTCTCPRGSGRSEGDSRHEWGSAQWCSGG
jgi:hypothetical protein